MLGIVIINYKNENEVLTYVQTELCKITYPHKIIIVDNSDSLGSIEYLEKCLNIKAIDKDVLTDNQIYLIDAKANLGYAKANNLGAEILIKNFNIKYILFSNTDIQLLNNDVVEFLIKKIEDNPKIGAINPKVIGPKGNTQTPKKQISIWKLHITRYLFYPFCRKISPIVKDAKEGKYNCLIGCFLLVKADVFSKSNMFDPSTFLFGEEMILAERMRRNGFESYYCPDKKILHLYSQTINSYYNLRCQLKMIFKGDIYYYKNYLKTSLFTILIARFSLYVYMYFYLPFIQLLKKSISK